MKRSFKNLFLIVMILISLIGTGIQASSVEALSAMANVAVGRPAGWVNGSVLGIWGTSDSVAYAVGYGNTATSAELPLFYAKNGSGGWDASSLPLPVNPPAPRTFTSGQLEAVWNSSANDIHAVGYGDSGGSRPLLYHWNGSIWTPFDPELPETITAGKLYDVFGFATNNVFAVGDGTSATTTLPLLYHYDGSSWTGGPLPLSSGQGYLSGVWGSGPNDIYAVGRVNTGGSGGTDSPLIYHYNGTAWTRVTSITVPAGWHSGQLDAVWGTGANDIYAVGSGTNEAEEYAALIYHYSDGSWQSVTPSKPDSWNNSFLYDVWGDGTNVYAVGKQGTQPLLYRKSSSGWAASYSVVGWDTAGYAGVWGYGTDNVYAVGKGEGELPLMAHAGSDMSVPGDVTGLIATSGASIGSVNLRWTAPADDAGAGKEYTGPVESYVVKYSESPLTSCAGGEQVLTGLPVPTAPGTFQTMTALLPKLDTRYYFAVCAQDEQGNLSAHAATDDAKSTILGAGTYDDTDSHWVYSSGWTAYTGSGPINDTEHYSSTSGSSAELTFTGVKFILTFTKYTNRGSISVLVDGVEKGPINAYSPTLQGRSTWTSPTLTADSHTVRFVHTGPTGKYIDIDAIQILDSIAIPPGIYDDTDSNWSYSSGWTAYTGSGPINDTEHYSSTAGSSAELTFTGRMFILTFTKYTNRGSISVLVDGVEQGPINAYSPTLQGRSTWTSPPLDPGTHTLQLVHAGPTGKYIDIDLIEILNTVAVGAGIHDDTDSGWTYSSGWTAYTGSGPINDTEHYTNTAGSTAQLSFTGRKFILTFTRYTNRGLISVLVDGVEQGPINAYSPTLQGRSTWASSTFAPGTHTVRFVHAGPAGKYIDIDAIQIVDTIAAVPAGIYDDTDSNWSYSSGWTAYTGSGPINDTEHYSSTAGSSAELTFTGRMFILTFTKYTNRGSISVLVDGVEKGPINAYSPTLQGRSTWTSPPLDPGTHTLQLVHAGPTGKYIDIDLIEILQDPIDPTLVTAGTYDDTDSHWVYSSGWTAYTGSGPINDTEHYSSTAGSSAELTFTGRMFILTFTRYTNRGSISVLVDGVEKGPINAYSPTLQGRSTWTSPPLTEGTHTLRLVHAGGGMYIDIDVIEILNTVAVPAGTYDDADSNWSYSSGWTAYTGSGPINDTEHYTNTAGSTAQLSFTGVKFILTFTRYTNRGLISVLVDGVEQGPINAYSPTLQGRSTWASPAFAAGTHTVRFVHAGPAGKYIDIDAIEILDTIAAVPAGTYDDTDSNWSYSSGWTAYNGGPGDTQHYTNTPGSSAEITFTGTLFTLTYVKYTNRGLIDVYIDDIPTYQIDAYSPTLQVGSTWSPPTALAPGTYTVRFVHAGAAGTYIDIDQIQITP